MYLRLLDALRVFALDRWFPHNAVPAVKW